MPCLFCRIIAHEIPCEKVYENEFVFAFLDIGPVSRGHTLFVPKTHAEDLTAGSREDAVHLMEAIFLLAPRICTALGATGYNLGMNHGVDAGQEVMHTHLHLMPRYAGEERGFVKQSPSKEELREVGEKIRSSM